MILWILAFILSFSAVPALADRVIEGRVGHIAVSGHRSEGGDLSSERYDAFLIYTFWEICTPGRAENSSKGQEMIFSGPALFETLYQLSILLGNLLGRDAEPRLASLLTQALSFPLALREIPFEGINDGKIGVTGVDLGHRS